MINGKLDKGGNDRMVVSDIILIPLCLGKTKAGRGGGLLQCVSGGRTLLRKAKRVWLLLPT